MPLLTFISDFGNKDPYVAVVKGALLSAVPSLNVIDVTHSVSPYDLMEAANILKSVIPYYPSKTLHLVGIETLHEESPDHFLAVHYLNQYLLMPDNGLVNMIFNTSEAHFFSLEGKKSTFGTLEVLVPAAIQLLNGKLPSDLGPVCVPVKMLDRGIRITRENLKGIIVYIDHFGNLHTNIKSDTIEEYIKNSKFRITIGRNTISKVSLSFYEVPEGELLAYWSHSNHLVIAIRGGKASSLLGMKVDSPVWIEFE